MLERLKKIFSPDPSPYIKRRMDAVIDYDVVIAFLQNNPDASEEDARRMVIAYHDKYTENDFDLFRLRLRTKLMAWQQGMMDRI